MPVAWNEDDPRDAALIEDNLNTLLHKIVQEATHRYPPSVKMVQDWHRHIYKDAHLPVPYYAGEFRDSDPQFPELYGYEVSVGTRSGIASARVPEELRRFEEALQEAVRRLDAVILTNRQAEGVAQVRSVLTLSAYTHGEWVRIHPFANGNGRTARLWANWCALRYGLPAFVRLKPRPDGLQYARAAANSMRGDHRSMIAEFAAMLQLRLSKP